jgi:hypothetical protein
MIRHKGENMLTRRISRVPSAREIVALVMLFSCGSLCAVESWEKKPYTEWTMQEAQKVLTGSPWSKVAIVRDLRSPTGLPIPSVITARPQPNGKCTSCGPRGGSDPVADDPGIGSASGWGPAPAGQAIYFRVVCFSSARIRQALIRLAQLNGDVVAPQILDRLQSPLAEYVIALAGPFVSALQHASVESLKASTYLRSRKKIGARLGLKQFISPAERADGMALFFFPRGTQDRPPFDATDGQVEFATGEGTSKISVSFRIDKMAVDGTLDF